MILQKYEVQITEQVFSHSVQQKTVLLSFHLQSLAQETLRCGRKAENNEKIELALWCQRAKGAPLPGGAMLN